MLRYAKSLWSYNPIPGGCVLYLPLWSPDLSGPVFKSPDPYGHVCTNYQSVYKGDKIGRDFDGTDDYLSFPHHSALNISGNLTVLVWVKFDTWTTAGYYPCVMSRFDPVAFKGYLLEKTNGATTFNFGVGDGVDTVACYSASGLVIDTWYLVGGNYDGTNVNFFLNGVADGTPAAQSAPAPYTGILTVGKHSILTGVLRQVDGKIPEVGIWNRALSAVEILYFYNFTKWRYS